MNEYTPTTEEVRDAWGYWRHEGTDWSNPEYAEEFNSWLDEHDREVIREFINQQVEYVRNVMASEETE